MKSLSELTEMTTREIAFEARQIMATHTPAESKELLKNYILVANAKLKAYGAKLNKEFGTHRMPPQIKLISDFNRFK